MGFITRGNLLYLNPKGGDLVGKNKDGHIINVNGFAGMILEITQKEDEFEGDKYIKIQVKMEDAGETVSIGFRLESWFGQTFFAKIGKVDLTQKVTVGANGSDKSEKISFCWIKQNGNAIEKDPNFPKPEKKSYGNKSIVLWDQVVAEADRVMSTMQIARNSDAPPPTENYSDDNPPLPSEPPPVNNDGWKG